MKTEASFTCSSVHAVASDRLTLNLLLELDARHHCGGDSGAL